MQTATDNAAKPSAVAQLEGLLKKMERMDYYQIIGSTRGADARDIRKKFYSRSKRYHPDRYHYISDPDFKKLVTTVYKQISEAYNVLKDPGARKGYDSALDEDREENLRWRPNDKNRKKKEEVGGNGPGSKYFRLAQQAVAASNFSSARNNIKLALMMEPKNEAFLALQQEINEAS